MRSDLAKLEGISNIVTDISTNRATFHLANKDLDLKAALAEFAKTNEHIEGWSLVADAGSAPATN